MWRVPRGSRSIASFETLRCAELGSPAGGYCGWIEVHVDDPSSVTELCATLTNEHNFLVLPGSVFGPRWNGFIRIGLSVGSESLLRGLDALVMEAGLR